jgi:hypothetical protein
MRSGFSYLQRKSIRFVTGIAVLFLNSIHSASPQSKSDEPEFNGGTGLVFHTNLELVF